MGKLQNSASAVEGWGIAPEGLVLSDPSDKVADQDAHAKQEHSPSNSPSHRAGARIGSMGLPGAVSNLKNGKNGNRDQQEHRQFDQPIGHPVVVEVASFLAPCLKGDEKNLKKQGKRKGISDRRIVGLGLNLVDCPEARPEGHTRRESKKGRFSKREGVFPGLIHQPEQASVEQTAGKESKDASLFPRGLEPKTLRTIHPILVRHVQPIALLARDLLEACELLRR